MATLLDDEEELQPPTAATAPPYVVVKLPFSDIPNVSALPKLTPEQLSAVDDTPLRYE